MTAEYEKSKAGFTGSLAVEISEMQSPEKDKEKVVKERCPTF
jgi:hypothetical protein